MNTTPTSNTVHTRHYSFALPVTLSSWYVMFAPNYLQQRGVWTDLPAAFQQKILDAKAAGTSLTVHKSDLDTISDIHWHHIEPLLTQTV